MTSKTAGRRRNTKGLILLSGANGYVGGRLRRRLVEQGEQIRCLTRHPEALATRVAPGVEVVHGDVLDSASLDGVFDGVETAYYLIHSMGSDDNFEEADRVGARNFAEAAKRAGVRRIIYLGGLAHGEQLSPHLRSRHETGRILAESGVPVLELRASIILGSGAYRLKCSERSSSASGHDHTALGRRGKRSPSPSATFSPTSWKRWVCLCRQVVSSKSVERIACHTVIS